MKKIIYAMIILSALLVSNITFKDTAEKDYQKYYYSNLITENRNTGEIFVLKEQYNNNEKLINEEINIIIDYLKKHTDIFLSAISRQEYGDLEKVKTYLYTTKEAPINVIEDKKISFNKDSDLYYTSDNKDSLAYNKIDYLDASLSRSKNTIQEFHTFKNYAQDILQQGSDVEFYVATKNENLLNDLFKQHPYLMDKLDFLPVGIIDNQNLRNISISNLEIIAIFLSILLLFFLHILHHNKNIMIAKLLGFNNMKITIKLFMKDILSFILLYLGVFIFMLFIKNSLFRPCAYAWIETLIIIWFGWIFINFLLFFIYYVFIACMQNIKEIQKHHKSKLFYLEQILKITVLIVLCVPFFQSLVLTFNNGNYYFYMKAKETEIKEMNYLGGYAKPLNKEEDKQMEDYLNTILNNYGYYADFISYNLNMEMNSFHTNVSNTLDNPFIIVNKTFLNDYIGYKKNMDNLENFIVLYPTEFNEDEIRTYCPLNQTCSYQSWDQSHVNQNPILYMDEYNLEKQIIIVIQDMKKAADTNFSIEFIPSFIKTKDLDKLDKDVIENIKIIKGKNIYDYYEQKQKDIFINNIVNSLVMLIVIVMYFISSVSLYLNEEARTCACKFLNGYSYFKRYGEMFVLNILVDCIAILIISLLYTDGMMYLLPMILSIFSLDFIVHVLLINIFEKKQLKESLMK